MYRLIAIPMHAFSKFKFAKRVFLLLSEKIGISYKVKKCCRTNS